MMTIDQIKSAKLPQLHALYAELYGKPTVNRNKQRLVKKLAAEVARRAPAKEKPAKGSKRSKRTPEDVGIGRVLHHKMRDGAVHECQVVAEGFKVGDKVYDSLGAAALGASGQQWNGDLFWGLKPYPKHKKAAK